jgi:hypothetical protein
MVSLILNSTAKHNTRIAKELHKNSKAVTRESFVPSFQTKVKAKCTLVQALMLNTGCTAHKGSRGIALLYRHCGFVQTVRSIEGVEV